MTLLDRMVLREILVPLGVGLLAILQLLVVLQLLQLNEIVFGSAVSLADLAHVTVALAPHFLVIAVPLAFMLGVQLGLGRLAGDNEVLAMSSSGRHPLELYRVPVAIALALAVAVAAMARWAEPWGLQQLNSVLNEIIKRNLESGLLPGVFNEQLPRFMIYVASEEPKKDSRFPLWRGVLIEDAIGDQSAPIMALAETGTIADDESDVLSLRLQHGEMHRFEAKGETVARFEEGTMRVGIGGDVRIRNKFDTIEQQMPGSILRERIAEAERTGEHRYAQRLRLELTRRWAVPLACLMFALLGVPLAVVARGVKGWAYLITLTAFVGFYALSRLGLALAEAGLNAWVAGFMPDAIVGGLGLFYSRLLFRHGVARA